MSNIYFVLDRSGSMASCVDDTIGGFNTFIHSQKKDNTDASMSLYLFDNEYTSLYENKLISEVSNIDTKTYIPRGSTSLLDAIGCTIKTAEITDNNIIVILTDGFENTSKSYTKSHIKDLIKMKESIGWNFVFLAANQDAISTAQSLGINPNGAMTFDKDCLHDAFVGLSAAVSRQATGEDSHVQFSGFERSASQALE
jgi:uncharacterized protein YegL